MLLNYRDGCDNPDRPIRQAPAIRPPRPHLEPVD
ncbi:hypothetical protein Mal4_16250 [Maioricimonas rarisocia]|uniref:Uncharacterized protein n=1 Tax=Maioricimonas rarisocia TaxID=2528026 RepID=A0A517Z4F6_9PLAN|nr:hypothetical protein Mal4_16250 [Maioricimonas rarisocia]